MHASPMCACIYGDGDLVFATGVEQASTIDGTWLNFCSFWGASGVAVALFKLDRLEDPDVVEVGVSSP